MSDSRIINLSCHASPKFEPFSTKGNEWVLNGKDNCNYQYVIDRYKYSPTNATVIDSYANYMNGKGITAKYNMEQAGLYAEVLKLISKKELKKVVKDFALFHEASVEVIQGKVGNKIVEINHLPKNKVVPNKVNDKGEIDSYWYCYDWSDTRKYKPEQIPVFKKDTKEKRTVFIFKEYNVDEFYFARPSYFSGLNYAELEEEISIYCVNHIKNGLSAGHIINFNDGEPDKEVKDDIERNVKNKLAGSNNAGKFILSFNANKENATTVESIEVSDAHQQYQFLSEEARRQILVAHKVISPKMFGIDTASGFSSNAEEIITAFDETMLNVIQPMQEVILDGYMELLSHNGNTLELEFIPLRQKPTQATTQLHKNHKFNETLIGKELIELGEEEDLSNYELVSCEPVNYEEEEKITHKFSTSTGTANPNRKSIYDTDFYLFRYRYAGNQNPEREFCKNMMKANKIYRREDIEAMSEIVVNPGFGMHPNPENPYSIWKFKGGGLLSAEYPGGTCKHYWEKLTYRIKDVKIDPKSPIAIEEAKKDRASGIAGIAPHDR